MENNKKTYENRSKNSFRKSFFVHHQAAWGLLHPTSGCSTMARRCFNAASGKRSVAAFPWNIVPWISSLFQCRKRQEVCCNLLLCRQSRQRLVRFQCRKRQEVCCNSDNIYFFNWLSKVSMPQAARGLLQHWLCNRANPSTAGFNAASGKRSVATIRFRIWWSEQYVSMPQAARGLLQQRIARTIISSCSLVSMPQAARGLLQHCVLEAAWTLAWKWGFGQPPRKSTHLALFSRGHRFVFLWKTGFSPCCWRVQRVHDLFGQPTPVLTRFRGCPTVF